MYAENTDFSKGFIKDMTDLELVIMRRILKQTQPNVKDWLDTVNDELGTRLEILLKAESQLLDE